MQKRIVLGCLAMLIGCGGAGSRPPLEGDSGVDPDSPSPDGPPVVPPDTTPDTPPPGPPIQNDVVNVRFSGDPLVDRALTASPTDQPDNQAAPLAIADASALRIDGTSDTGGNQNDEYHERDTYLITTGAGVTQLTVRLEWDGATADHDFMLFREVPAGGQLAPEVGGGTLIADAGGELQTIAVEPNTNYWLWAGVYQVIADGSAPPTLPRAYDFSLYGAAFDITGANTNCTFTEAADATNDDLSPDATGTPEVSGQTFDAATVVLCGNLDASHFDATNGIVDVDSFGVAVANDLSGALLVMTGPGIEALESVQFAALSPDGTVALGAFSPTGKYGVQIATLPANTTSFSVFATNPAAIPANLPYKLAIQPDDPSVRAPRIGSAANLTEANDR